MKKKLGIVIPVANEEATIVAFCKELITYSNKINMQVAIFFVIDDASKDKTRKILTGLTKKNAQIHVIYEPKNKNVVEAYVRGYKEAIKRKCDFIIEMDAGFSHLPSELYKFVDGFNEGYDCVLGVRPLLSPFYKVPLKRRILSMGGTILANILLGTKGKDMTSGFEGFTRKAAKEIVSTPLKSTGHFFQTEMRYRARKFKTKQVQITYKFPSPRVTNNSIKNSYQTLFYLAKKRLH